MDKNEKVIELFEKIDSKKINPFLDCFNVGFKGLYAILKLISKTEKELTSGEIAKQIGISTARMAVVLKNLEKHNYIIKKKSLKDARNTTVTITEYGLEKVGMYEKEIYDMMCKFFEKLTEQEIESLLSIADKI